ncbi:hypothetical protein ITR00_09370 [Pediococcus pentosaceus]|nr:MULTISPECIES: hypothetical protein [Lactobacillaceae]MBF7126215.1 hypothetical protein [Pediococcus pentosaceus]WPK17602.1 hypothetical protein R6U75_09895 [Pediococcus pentosaceus]
MKLINLNFKRWVRGNRLLVVTILFVFTAIFSPIMAYNAAKILDSLGSTVTSLPIPDETSLLQSYFKNMSQLILFVVVFLISSMTVLPKSESVHIFYLSRTKKGYRIYYPKILVGLSIVVILLILNDVIFYSILTLYFNELDTFNIVTSLCIQLLGFFTMTIVGVTVSIIFNSSFIGAALIELFIFIGSIFATYEWFKEWSPTTLLSPIDIFHTGSIESITTNIIISVLVIVVSLGIIGIKKA